MPASGNVSRLNDEEICTSGSLLDDNHDTFLRCRWRSSEVNPNQVKEHTKGQSSDRVGVYILIAGIGL